MIKTIHISLILLLFFVHACSEDKRGEEGTEIPKSEAGISPLDSGNEASSENTSALESKLESVPALKGSKNPDSLETSLISGYPLKWSGVSHYNSGSISLVSGSVVTEAPELSKATVYISVGGYHCSGTLIGDKTVITAGHCIAANGSIRMTSSNTKVGFGDDKSSMTYVDAESYHLHPSYDYSGSFNPLAPDDSCADLAVIRLKESAPSTAIPISIYPSTASVSLEYRAILAGWGRIESGSFATKLISGETNLNHIDPVLGTIYFGDNVSTLLGDGDSGGPMYYVDNGHLYLYGVNSATLTFEDGSMQDFACDVNSAADWLSGVN